MNKKKIRDKIHIELNQGNTLQDIFNKMSLSSRNDYEKTKLAELFSTTPTPNKISKHNKSNKLFLYLLVINFFLKIFLFFYVLPILLKANSPLLLLFFIVLLAIYLWMIWVVLKMKIEAYNQVGFLLILNVLSISNTMNHESDLHIIFLISIFLNLILILLAFLLRYLFKTSYKVNNVEYKNEEGKIDIRKDFIFNEK